MFLRTYLYRNDLRISEYLEQLHDGARGEATVKVEGERSKGAGLSGGPLPLHAEFGSKNNTSESFTIGSTPTSRAAQLEDLVHPQPLARMDDESFSQIKRREMVLFQGVLKIPEVVSMAYMAASVGKMATLAEAVGETLEGVDQVISQIDALREIIRMDGFPILATEVSGGPGVMLIAQPDLIIGEPSALDGEEVTIFGIVKQLVARGQTINQSELLPHLDKYLPQPKNRQARRASPGGIEPVTLAGPGALIDPITIYI